MVGPMNPTIILIPLCGVTILGAAILSGRFGEGTGLRAIGIALLLFGAAGIGTLLFARRLKVWVDGLADNARKADRDRPE
ncbi:MAG: hypothetical protein HLUCCA04_03690 [Oceanicaulis sp. HLUCCA04]|nr:MAG: hypothetical protein HLUCCA04_03690 [Oceanicaulis sp. HLUCCA04]